MTDQEKKINDIADALVNKFKDYSWMSYVEGYEETSIIESATKCAIECQREKIEEIELIYKYYDSPFIKDRLTEAQQVLENLQARLL